MTGGRPFWLILGVRTPQRARTPRGVRALTLAAIEETALKLDGGGAAAPAEPTEEL